MASGIRIYRPNGTIRVNLVDRLTRSRSYFDTTAGVAGSISAGALNSEQVWFYVIPLATPLDPYAEFPVVSNVPGSDIIAWNYVGTVGATKKAVRIVYGTY